MSPQQFRSCFLHFLVCAFYTCTYLKHCSVWRDVRCVQGAERKTQKYKDLQQTDARVIISSKVFLRIVTSASKRSIRRFVFTEKAPTRAFSWLKAPTIAFTFKTLLRHYAKRALTPRSLNMKLGPQCKGHKGRAVW